MVLCLLFHVRTTHAHVHVPLCPFFPMSKSKSLSGFPRHGGQGHARRASEKPEPCPHSVTTDRKALRTQGRHPWSSCHHYSECQNRSVYILLHGGKRDRRFEIAAVGGVVVFEPGMLEMSVVIRPHCQLNAETQQSESPESFQKKAAYRSPPGLSHIVDPDSAGARPHPSDRCLPLNEHTDQPPEVSASQIISADLSWSACRERS